MGATSVLVEGVKVISVIQQLMLRLKQQIKWSHSYLLIKELSICL